MKKNYMLSFDLTQSLGLEDNLMEPVFDNEELQKLRREFTSDIKKLSAEYPELQYSLHTDVEYAGEVSIEVRGSILGLVEVAAAYHNRTVGGAVEFDEEETIEKIKSA